MPSEKAKRQNGVKLVFMDKVIRVETRDCCMSTSPFEKGGLRGI